MGKEYGDMVRYRQRERIWAEIQAKRLAIRRGTTTDPRAAAEASRPFTRSSVPKRRRGGTEGRGPSERSARGAAAALRHARPGQNGPRGSLPAAHPAAEAAEPLVGQRELLPPLQDGLEEVAGEAAATLRHTAPGNGTCPKGHTAAAAAPQRTRRRPPKDTPPPPKGHAAAPQRTRRRRPPKDTPPPPPKGHAAAAPQRTRRRRPPKDTPPPPARFCFALPRPSRAREKLLPARRGAGAAARIGAAAGHHGSGGKASGAASGAAAAMSGVGSGAFGRLGRRRGRPLLRSRAGPPAPFPGRGAARALLAPRRVGPAAFANSAGAASRGGSWAAGPECGAHGWQAAPPGSARSSHRPQRGGAR
ncbi:serine/arginine repetitive matrix protein 1-like [Cuculus canorus]|uniref:serine/arginine repetitive matrix protein 1-like n=1 Tax=Cuculus canorus TaxID=55661 RepID=UPI0023AB3480|nr:serine/arginine repetitive matrix protein 1-like [Cuculus canorus]